MSVRRLVVSIAVATAAVVLPSVPSYAAGPSDVYVTATGADNPDCSQGSPCATLDAALLAVEDAGIIHVGAGTFDGAVIIDKTVAIVGVSPEATVLTTPQDTGPQVVLAITSGTTSLSDLQLKGGLKIGAYVVGPGSLEANHVLFADAGCNLAVQSGSAALTDSVVQNGGSGGCPPDYTGGEIVVTGGSVSLLRTQVLSPAPDQPGVRVSDGSFTADQSVFDDSAHPGDLDKGYAVGASAGTVEVTRSTFRAFGVGVHVAGGTALVRDDTFLDNVVGVDGGVSASITVVRSTFEHELASLQGNVSVTGSVLGSMLGSPAIGIAECNPAGGTIADLGYNLSSDASCGFAGTSQDNVGTMGLGSGLTDHGGPVPTVATFWQSPAVDYIPADATYGDPATPLCPASGGTDARGVPRPQAGACDAGSMELVATTTSLQTPATAEPLAPVSLDATVTDPDVGVDGLEALAGTVTFSSGATVLCADVAMESGVAHCTTSALTAGRRPVKAVFTPEPGSTWHASLDAGTIDVGTRPGFTSTNRARFVVGKARTFSVLTSGSPSARITVVKGRLPAGLVFRVAHGRATISGKARTSAVGRHQLTLEASNLRGSVRQVLRVVVRR